MMKPKFYKDGAKDGTMSFYLPNSQGIFAYQRVINVQYYLSMTLITTPYKKRQSPLVVDLAHHRSGQFVGSLLSLCITKMTVHTNGGEVDIALFCSSEKFAKCLICSSPIHLVLMHGFD